MFKPSDMPPKRRFRPAWVDPNNPANWGPLVPPLFEPVVVAGFSYAQMSWRKVK